MDEPRIKYVPVEAVKEYIKRYAWLTAEFDEMIDKYGIDVVEYKCCVTVSDEEAAIFNGYTNFPVEKFAKRRASDRLADCIDKHIKLSSKERLPATRSTEYRYDIMIGEIPKWQQKGEEEDA